jgi:hypothetical protein
MTRMVRLDQIRLDGGTQFRDQIDQHTVKHYTDCMRDGAEFPPVHCTFDGVSYWLYDGFHRYFASQAVGFKEMAVDYKPGTQEDAQDLALSANAKHGLPRNNATKRKQVETALSMERHANKSDREIAKLCDVSATFVATVRNPEAKERQAKNREASAVKNAVESDSTIQRGDVVETQQVKSDFTPSLTQDYGPDADEMKAMEMAEQADRDTMYKMLESDDALATAVKEIERLNFLNAQLQIRINALMNEKNAAVKMVKDLEKQLKKAKK